MRADCAAGRGRGPAKSRGSVHGNGFGSLTAADGGAGCAPIPSASGYVDTGLEGAPPFAVRGHSDREHAAGRRGGKTAHGDKRGRVTRQRKERPAHRLRRRGPRLHSPETPTDRPPPPPSIANLFQQIAITSLHHHMGDMEQPLNSQAEIFGSPVPIIPHDPCAEENHRDVAMTGTRHYPIISLKGHGPATGASFRWI